MRVWIGSGVAFRIGGICCTGNGLAQIVADLAGRCAQARPAPRARRQPPRAARATRSPRSTTGRWAWPAGLPEGTFLRFAAEIARNLNDSDESARAADRHAGRHRQRQGPALSQGHRHRHHARRRVRALPQCREDPQHREARELHLRDVHLGAARAGAARDQLVQGSRRQEGQLPHAGRRPVGDRARSCSSASASRSSRSTSTTPSPYEKMKTGRDRRAHPHGRQAERPVHEEQERARASSSCPFRSTSSMTSTCRRCSRPRTIRAT